MDVRVIIVPLALLLGAVMMYLPYKNSKEKKALIEAAQPKPGHIYFYKDYLRNTRKAIIWFNEVEIAQTKDIEQFIEVPITEPGRLSISGGLKGLEITEQDLTQPVVVKITFGKYTNGIFKVKLNK